MTTSEKFCLRWNDFESNISVAFRELREEKDFFDVTLACEDNQIQAHKVILSACSPFFRNVLRRNPHQHPLLYLKGVKYQELQSVLNFMYMGEVNVAQEELNSFLAVAEDLRVKGLTQNNSSNSSSNKTETTKLPIRPRDPPERDPVTPPPKRPRPPPAPPVQPPQQSFQSSSTYDDDDIQEVVPVKSEPREATVASVVSVTEQQNTTEQYVPQDVSQQPVDDSALALDDESYADESYDYGQYGDGGYDDGSGMIDPNTGMPFAGAAGDGNKVAAAESELDTVISSRMMPTPDGEYQCLDCPYRNKTRQRLRYHIESKHVSGPGHICDICQKVCPTKNALCLHRSRYHKSEIKSHDNSQKFLY